MLFLRLCFFMLAPGFDKIDCLWCEVVMSDQRSHPVSFSFFVGPLDGHIRELCSSVFQVFLSLLCKLCYALCVASSVMQSELCNLGLLICAMRSSLCYLCHTIFAMQCWLYNHCYATSVMQSLSCSRCCAASVMQPVLRKHCYATSVVRPLLCIL